MCFRNFKIKKEVVGGLFIFIGLYLLLGAAGGIDCDTISLFEAVIRSLVGIAFLGSGVYVGELWEYRE